MNGTPDRGQGAGAEAEAQAMVARAIALFDARGEAALAVFNQGAATGYEQGDIYIVVQSMGADARVVADGGNPGLVGTPLSQIQDHTGQRFGEAMNAEATATGGWFTYEWLDPATGRLGHKRSWAVLHKNHVFIAGYYVP